MADIFNELGLHDICINDDSIFAVSSECCTKKDEVKKLINRYTDILHGILNDGVMSGDFHDKLQLFSDNFNGLTEELDDIYVQIQTQINRFLRDFEKADAQLY